jgi:hypothetical protein
MTATPYTTGLDVYICSLYHPHIRSFTTDLFGVLRDFWQVGQGLGTCIIVTDLTGMRRIGPSKIFYQLSDR